MSRPFSADTIEDCFTDIPPTRYGYKVKITYTRIGTYLMSKSLAGTSTYPHIQFPENFRGKTKKVPPHNLFRRSAQSAKIFVITYQFLSL